MSLPVARASGLAACRFVGLLADVCALALAGVRQACQAPSPPPSPSPPHFQSIDDEGSIEASFVSVRKLRKVQSRLSLLVV
eukprot:CAMPEP_0185446430 /NCGR_PEP_ID=MMETSP1365-20130426/54277_1 /TAXON_ID=38817 /ORGANISM="Gephyrocapsa oceanica, Strain RCC1303" /LENGTH=80 /DNA_ID=CAMNT_0028052243 /DNA_START=30 /DNA_END=273 /DNA_ORIENTATION=+